MTSIPPQHAFQTPIANIAEKNRRNFNAQGRLKELNRSLSNSYQYQPTGA
jgi:hypothetical protein